MMQSTIFVSLFLYSCNAYVILPNSRFPTILQAETDLKKDCGRDIPSYSENDRRSFLSRATVATFAILTAPFLSPPKEAGAVGPVRITLENPVYSAQPCPKDRPIPGEKAMKGMRVCKPLLCGTIGKVFIYIITSTEFSHLPPFSLK